MDGRGPRDGRAHGGNLRRKLLKGGRVSGGAGRRTAGNVALPAREFKAVFFDLDGTLVDIHGPLYIAARKALAALGQEPPLTRERYREAVSQSDPWLGIPEHLRDNFAQLAFAYFVAETDSTERLEVLPHVGETLAELKRRGYATGVVTSRPGKPRRLLEKLAMVGLASHLDQVLTQDRASLMALDKTQSLRQASMRVGVLPAACMYVGDEPRDIMAAAKAAYGAAVAVATGPASYEHLLNHPEYRPHFVMRSMGELLGVLDELRDEQNP
jgi:N-acetyl-D-muramate 6-phosphate phosphatase